jgi:hypothetical protein
MFAECAGAVRQMPTDPHPEPDRARLARLSPKELDGGEAVQRMLARTPAAHPGCRYQG